MTKDSGISSRRIFWVFCLLVLLLAAALRTHDISKRSLWLDEAIAANVAQGSLFQTLILTRALHSAPIVHPLILYGVERVSATPLAVRLPSLSASVLAVLLMLCLAQIPDIGYLGAGLSGLMMSVSAMQVRYAQEVREYSLSVLYAALLLFLFLWHTRHKTDKEPILLYVALFIAPFVQYGLVLFGCGIIAALLILMASGSRERKPLRIIIASASLAFGGFLSLLLTLRYQWGDSAPYLEDFYYTHGKNIVGFALSHTHSVITAFLPGLAVGVITLVAVCVSVFWCIRLRVLPPLTVLAFTSSGIVLICAIVHEYPYGPVRQCLFLSPVIVTFAAVSLAQACDRFRGYGRKVLSAVIVLTIAVSGVAQLRSMNPYQEIENIRPVLATLTPNLQPHDTVYIYPGAVPAVNFYMKSEKLDLVYGNYHQDAPDLYTPEIESSTDARCTRLWLVFSHVYRDEPQQILRDLSLRWDVEPVVSTTGSALYLARRGFPMEASGSSNSPSNALSLTSTKTIESPASFWDWSIRNCSRPFCKNTAFLSRQLSYVQSQHSLSNR